MKRFLYITPYFPPNCRVGALRPLKFSRHIPDFGWEPVIFCDLKTGDTTDRKLAAQIPAGLSIHRTYSRNADTAWREFESGNDPAQRKRKSSTAKRRNRFWDNPELIPFGEHLVDIPNAIKNGRKLLKSTPCDAIVVNMDPYAAGYVGKVLAGEFGLPLILDLRDPWSVCELRRPMRPALIRRFTDRLERSMVSRSAAVILNTETALGHYRDHYSDIDPGRFTCIKNFGDRELIDHGTGPDLHFRTILFMGNLRRFIDGFEILEVLRELKKKGMTPDKLRLVISGQILPETLKKAAELDVSDMILSIEPVSYTEVYPLMLSSDILLVIAHNSVQRIPAKFYDYAITGKPVLAVSKNDELNKMVELSGGKAFDFDDADGMAGYIMDVLGGTNKLHTASEPAYTAEEGSRELARLLDSIVGDPT